MRSAAPTGANERAEPTRSERIPMTGHDLDGDVRDNMGRSRSDTSMLDDAQIAAITELVNDDEIKQAELAQSKSKSPRVLSFAAMMIRHHGEAKQKQSALNLYTQPSPLLRTLASNGETTLATLAAKTGVAFDQAYLQAQIAQHQQMLDELDRELLPNAQNERLRAHLESLKPTLRQHLEAAREAERALRRETSPSGGQRTGTGSATAP